MPLFRLPRFLPQGGQKSGETPARRERLLLKCCAPFLALVAVAFLFRLLGLEEILDPAWADRHLRDSGQGGFAWNNALLYLAMTALLAPLGIPRQALSALGGYAFGALNGAVLCSIGLPLGCAAAFWYSRLLAGPALRQRFGKRIQRLDAFVSRSPFAMTAAIRFFPMGNNALTNLAAGVTSIPASAFIGGSAVGYLPQTIIFALLGSGVRVDPFWRIIVAAVLFALSSAVGISLYHKYKGEQLLDGVAETPVDNIGGQP